MKLFIPKDIFDNPRPPRVFLATTGKNIMGQLPAYDVSLDGKWNAYAELSFSIDRQYTDVLTGVTVVNPLFDKAEGLRKVYVENIGYFVIQDPDVTYGESDTKSLSCFSSEYETGNKYLENFRINTGDVDSAEVIYLSSIYGENYTIDTPYTVDTNPFDTYESYYIKDYQDSDSYVYQQVEINDESEHSTYDQSTVAKTLYVKKFPNVRFYYPTKPELSLLHLIFAKIPGWKIGNVDVTLWRKERKFDEDRIAVYDFLMNDVSDTFKCVVEWDTITNTVNFYEEAEDGINDDNTIQTRFDTDVFISRNNLANEINISYSTDDIKTKLKVSGADDLDIREINLGKNYIMNLDYYHDLDWMEQDLFEAYDDYLETVKLYSPQYTDAVQGRVAIYNKWNDLMNAVPAEGNVVLVGDTFEKLYCVYTPINTAYSKTTLTNLSVDTTVDILYSDAACTTVIDKTSLSDGKTFVVQGYSFTYVLSDKNFKCVSNMTEQNLNGKKGLKAKLKLYHVNEDTKGIETDNILLKLMNNESDMATIRIYNSGTESSPNYLIQRTIVRASSGLTDAITTYTLDQWIKGDLTAIKMGLKDFTVRYIGVMGSYFVLAKDEKNEANLQDYGINLLKEKHDTYTTIFQTQTEAMFSQEKYQCTASNEAPTGTIAENTRWLDTDSSPVKLYQYTSGKWVEISAEISKTDQKNYENYQRYIDNYEKLQAVQKVLLKKETQAQYLSDGFAVSDRKINFNLYKLDNDGVLRYKGQSLEADMHRAAEKHFEGYTVARKSMDTTFPFYAFTTSKYPKKSFVVYLKGTTPYVAYEKSVGAYEARMNRLNQLTDMENFFTEDQWIRLSPFIKEDEFSDSNFLLNGYESEEERLEICKELFESANKELDTLCQPSLEFSMDMANILALPEFKSLINQFQLGNFVRVYIRDGYVKRARLLEVHLNFDDLSDFSANFGNLITTKSEIDKHAELLSQAVTAGKQVATAAGDWQKAVDKSSRIEEEIANGLQNSALEVGKASGQSIVWDSSGIWGRKLIDGTTDQYEDEQFRIINNKLVFSNDGFKTSKSVMGKFVVDGVERWGVLSDAVVSGYIEGSAIKGGSLEIGGDGGRFVVNEDGSVQILAADSTPVYATKDDMEFVSKARQYHIELEYSGSTVFSEPNSSCTIICKVYNWDEDITDKVKNANATFSWIRSSNTDDTVWNIDHANRTTNTISITNTDVTKNSQFACEVQFDDTKITT